MIRLSSTNNFILILCTIWALCLSLGCLEANYSTRNAMVQKKVKDVSTLMDRDLFAEDLSYAKELVQLDYPLHIWAYPVVPYSTPGTGYDVFQQSLNNKLLNIVNFYVSAVAPDSGKVDLFTLVVVSDTIVENENAVVSRNHPTYLAQGIFNTEYGPIDFVGISDLDEIQQLIVSTRVFDLNDGKTIVVIPNKNQSLRFYQFQVDNGAWYEQSHRTDIIENIISAM